MIFLLLLGIVYCFLAFSMESTIVRIIYFGVAIGLFFWWWKEREEVMRKIAEKKARVEEEYRRIPHTQMTISEDVLHALVLDERTSMLHIAQREDLDAELEIETVQFTKIYEVAIEEDEKIQSKVVKNGRLGGSLLGEEERALCKDKESIEYSDEEDEDEIETASKLSIKMVIDNLDNPIVEYVFMEKRDPIEKKEDDYREALELCEQWYQRISVIIKRYEFERVSIRN